MAVRNNTFERDVIEGDMGDDAWKRTGRAHGGDAAPTGGVPQSATAASLLSVLGHDADGDLDVTVLWEGRAPLRSPLGLQAGGSPVWLNLGDRDADGDGTHGIVVGAPGSGKSTALQSILFALCAQHSPNQLQAMCVTTNPWSVFDDYPHLIPIPSGVDAAAALLALLAHRAEASAVTPRTVVMVDDFSPYPDPAFAAAVETLMREGQRYGIHVVLAAQRLDPVRNIQAWNPRHRVALRTVTIDDSWQLIGGPAASELPESAGLGLWRGEADTEPVLFRSFQVPRDLVRSVGRQLASSRGR